MLVGPKRAISGPNEPPRSDRVIADSWRGLYGSALFPSMLRGAAFALLRNGAIRTNILILGVFFRTRMAARVRSGTGLEHMHRKAAHLQPEPDHPNLRAHQFAGQTDKLPDTDNLPD